MDKIISGTTGRHGDGDGIGEETIRTIQSILNSNGKRHIRTGLDKLHDLDDLEQGGIGARDDTGGGGGIGGRGAGRGGGLRGGIWIKDIHLISSHLR